MRVSAYTGPYMSQQAGKDLDNDIANAVYEHTGPNVVCHPTRGSGNVKSPQGDVVIRTNAWDYVVELKRNSRTDRGDRATFLKEEDLEQLKKCSNDYTMIYVGLKMTHCQMVCAEVEVASQADDASDLAESLAENMPEAFDANATRSNNVTIRKPVDTDVWPSATAGKSDAEVVCDAIGVEYYE